MYSLADVVLEVKQAYPELNGRAEKAANLVQSGMVHRAGPNSWYVTSQSDGERTYKVWFELSWVCECPDYQTVSNNHPAPVLEAFGSVGPICKHCLAVIFDWLIDSHRESE